MYEPGLNCNFIWLSCKKKEGYKDLKKNVAKTKTSFKSPLSTLIKCKWFS